MNISGDEGFFSCQQTVRRTWIPLFPLCTMYFVPRKNTFSERSRLKAEKSYEWFSYCFNRYRCTWCRLPLLRTLACKEMVNRPKCQNPCLHTWGWRRLCSLLQIYRILTSVFFHRRCRSCHRSDPCICFWMGSGIALAHHRRTFLRCCTGLRCFICIRKKWR